MSEFDHEPIRGLPGQLPAGEHILWQGAPDWRMLARTAFHVRKVAAYFALLALWGAATGSWTGAAVTLAMGAAGVGLLHLFAWAAARSTVYTLTEKRLVFRYGTALTKCINVPLAMIERADLRLLPRGTGDIPLRIVGRPGLGWLMLWPHARPWAFATPQPMLRAIPDAQGVARMLAERLAAAGAPLERPAPAPPRKEVLAA